MEQSLHALHSCPPFKTLVVTSLGCVTVTMQNDESAEFETRRLFHIHLLMGESFSLLIVNQSLRCVGTSMILWHLSSSESHTLYSEVGDVWCPAALYSGFSSRRLFVEMFFFYEFKFRRKLVTCLAQCFCGNKYDMMMCQDHGQRHRREVKLT